MPWPQRRRTSRGSMTATRWRYTNSPPAQAVTPSSAAVAADSAMPLGVAVAGAEVGVGERQRRGVAGRVKMPDPVLPHAAERQIVGETKHARRRARDEPGPQHPARRLRPERVAGPPVGEVAAQRGGEEGHRKRNRHGMQRVPAGHRGRAGHARPVAVRVLQPPFPAVLPVPLPMRIGLRPFHRGPVKGRRLLKRRGLLNRHAGLPCPVFPSRTETGEAGGRCGAGGRTDVPPFQSHPFPASRTRLRPSRLAR